MNLFINLYKCKNNHRQEEIIECLTRNISNPLLDVYVLNEGFDLPPTVNQKFIDHRPTYNDYFDYANQVGGIKIIANNDIYFDESVKYIENIMDRECYALTRYNVGGGLECKSGGSQDVWVFRSEINVDGDFYSGKLGCDNRIAYEIDKAGYFVSNPAKTIRTHHLHKSDYHTYSHTDKIPPPYKIIPVTEQYCKRRILHFSLGPSTGKTMNKALQSFGNYKELVWQHHSDPSKELLKVCRQWKPDFIFAQIQKGNILTVKAAQKIHKMGIPIFNWTGDVRHPLPQWFKDIGKYCVTLFTNQNDVDEMREEGYDADYLQVGLDENEFNPFRGKLEDGKEIVFFANHYRGTFPLSNFRYDVAKALKDKYGDKFGLYGRGWPQEFGARNLNGNWDREARLYSSCKIAINISHFNYSRYSSDRLLRAMGSGAFVLSHNFKDIKKDYNNNILKTFNTIPELIDKIDRYLANDEQRIEVAKNGCLYVRKNCTWAKRIDELRELMKKRDI